MSNQLPPSVQSLIDVKMSTGIYESQEQLLLEALHALDDFEESIADIREAMEDELAGRVKTIAEADREMRQELEFLQ